METPFSPVDDVVVIPTIEQAPGLGALPVYAFLLRGPEPALIDAGVARERRAFLRALDGLIDASSLRWVVLTHEDADHSGALLDLLALAPRARVVATPLTLAKFSAVTPLDPERVVVVAPGARVDLGPRRFSLHQPPLYDSPGTVMLLEEREGWLFSSDAFGALLPRVADRLDELDRAASLDGMSLFCRLNSPWLSRADAPSWRADLDEVAALAPTWLFASHLPPAMGADVSAVFERARALPHEAGAPPTR